MMINLQENHIEMD